METINVAVRVRPSKNVLDESITLEILSQDPPVLFLKDRQQHFSFDKVFPEDAPQEVLYEDVIKPLLSKVLMGYNCTAFAYGQTGTGKTYTIGSDPETNKDAGFIIRTLDDIFNGQEEYREVSVLISFLEIYNERVFDLLRKDKKALPVKGFQIEGLSLAQVTNSFEAKALLRLGSRNRHIGCTKFNTTSSRSHAVFTVHCKVKHENHETEAKFNFVDLAGSESARKTGSKGPQFSEGVNINKGLLQVGMVVQARSTNKTHVPYRGSVLTMILHDSLDKQNYIAFVACASPDAQDAHETFHTLLFAEKMKRLKNNPEINTIVQQYKIENPNIFGSAVKQTPFKRPISEGLPSTVKKPKPLHHSWTPSMPQTNGLSSLASMSESTISNISVSDPPQISLSPVVQSIVQKCTQATTQVFMANNIATPQIFIQQLHSEVSQILRTEIVKYSVRNSRACSSPFGSESHRESRLIAKKLFNEEIETHTEELTPLESDIEASMPLESDTEELKPPETDVHEFRVPAVPTKKTKRKTKAVIRGIDDPGPSNPRRSRRLSTRQPLSPDDPPVQRRSTRLSLKRPATDDDIQKNAPTPRKRAKLNDATPSKKASNKDAGSPATNHNLNVLNILNRGSQKDLQKLGGVGPKTAMQIFLYRQLHGQFGSIADLGKMESWRGTAFQRFLQGNFIKLEEEDK